MSKQNERKAQTARLSERNTLNDLTGREWVYALNSVELTDGDHNLLVGDQVLVGECPRLLVDYHRAPGIGVLGLYLQHLVPYQE